MKILVVDDHALVREGLQQVLKSLDECVQVIPAGNCMQAFALAHIHQDLDLILLDYQLPDMNGMEALAVFGERHPELPVLVFSGSVNLQIMRQVLQAGASGFVTKSSVSDQLLQAVRMVLAGEVFLPEGLLNLEDPNALHAKPPLSQRQHLVLQCLLDGMSNREIGETLNVSDETVKNHISAILRHFDVQNRTQAVVLAARAGYKALTDG